MKSEAKVKINAIRRKKSASGNIYCEVDFEEKTENDDSEFDMPITKWESVYCPKDISQEDVIALTGCFVKIFFNIFNSKRKHNDKVYDNLKMSIDLIEKI